MRQFVFSVLAFLLSWALVNCAQLKKGVVKTHDFSTTNVLAAYGEQVYKREKCTRCHTLNLDSASFSKISIDGQGGLRSSEWLYALINNAQDVIPGVRMPRFDHLLFTDIHTDIIELVRKDLRMKKKEKFLLFDRLIFQADSLQKNLELGYGKSKKRAEVLALIQYIQQIPASPFKRIQDSLKNIQINNRLAKFEILYKDSDSLWLRLKEDPRHLTLGKKIFRMNCMSCHSSQGEGLIGPNLTDAYWINGSSKANIAKIIMDGNANGMPEFKSKLTPIQVGRLVLYVESIRDNPVDGKAPQGEKE